MENSSTGGGGGLFFEYSSPRIVSNEFYNNSSVIGGGFVSLQSEGIISLVNNIVEGNSSIFFGVGIAFVESSSLLVNYTIIENLAI